MSVFARVGVEVDGSKAISELNKVKDASESLNGAFGAIKAAAAALAGALAVKAIADVGDQSQKSKLQLQSLTEQYGDLEKATDSVNRIQKVLGVSAIDAREGYSQLYAALRGTGLETEQLEVLFVGLTKAARLSGAGAEEAQGAMLQLKQAFASGTLSGDELRAVLETMPAFTQAVAKETDRLGLTSNATSADIKKLGSEGKITSDILFAAAKNLATANTRSQTSSESLSVAVKNLYEKIAEAFGPAVTQMVTTFAAAVGAFGRWVTENQAGITAFVTGIVNFAKVVGPLAAGVWLVVKAYQAWTVATKALAAAKAFLTALSGPQGIALVAAAAAAAGVAYVALNNVLKGTEAELKKQVAESDKANKQFKEIAKNTGELPNKTKAAAEATREYTEAWSQTLSKIRAATSDLNGQLAALERGSQISSARIQAEQALNDLQKTQLERQYEIAQSAQERYNISVELFKNEIQAAELEYRAKLETIALEQKKLKLQVEQAELKWQEIKAEGELQVLKAKDADAAAEKRQQMEKALDAQSEAIKLAKTQIQSNEEIAGYQREAAKYQMQSRVETAKVGFEQRVTSKEIGISKNQAYNLANQLGYSVSRAQTLTYAMNNVATSAYNAANAIQRANNAAAQRPRAQWNNDMTQFKGYTSNGGYMDIKAHYASGGYVTRPTAAMIGEGGEPEYVIPQSQAGSFAQNWLSGARGAAAMSMGGGGGGVNITVNTGPVTEINGQQYVTVDDMKRAMQATANQVMSRLRTPSARIALGR